MRRAAAGGAGCRPGALGAAVPHATAAGLAQRRDAAAARIPRRGRSGPHQVPELRMTRLAVVAGGTAGVGLANARALADRGWDVAVLARDEARLRATMADLEGRGRRALGITTDMSDAGAVEHAAERV